MGFDVQAAQTPPKRSSTRSRPEAGDEVGRQIENACRPGPGRLGRRDVVRDAAPGREPVGQERGQGGRADRGDAQMREARSSRPLAQRPPIDRHLFLTGFAQALDRVQKECPGK